MTPTEDKRERARIAERKYYRAHKEKVNTKNRLKSRRRKIEAIEYLGGVCKRCNGKFHPSIYEFHHRDPELKDSELSKMLQLSWIRLAEELDKCDLLCANCHRLAHHEEKYPYEFSETIQ